MADKGRKLTDRELNSLERRLGKQYASEQTKLQRQIRFKLLKFNVQDKSRRLLVESGLMNQEAYDSWRRAELSQSRYINRLIDDISNDMLKLNRKSAELINKSNEKVYRENFKQGSLEAGGKKKRNDHSTLPQSRINESKDLQWNKQKLKSMLMQSIKRNEDVEQIAQRLSGITEMNRNSAIRSARTFATGTENKALLDSFMEAKKEGAQIKKKWVATLDERTRVSHASMNGEVVELEEHFSNGLMYPGDPDGPAREVFNCRCRLEAEVG